MAKLRSAVMADLAVVHFQQCHVDEGCVWTHRAVDLRAEQGDILRVYEERRLKVALRPYLDVHAVREVVERLKV